MSENRQLAWVDLSTGLKDNSYFLYEDGLVARQYDENDFSYNLRERCEINELGDYIKSELLAACKPEDKELAKKLLYPEN